MSRVRVEDFYDEDDEPVQKTHNHKHKNLAKESKDEDAVFEKERKKFKTKRIKQYRRVKNENEDF